MLLGREDVNPDQLDNGGLTPLSEAALFGQEEVVKILCEQEEVNTDPPDNDDRTILSMTTGWGCERVVAWLHSHKTVTSSTI